MTKKIGLTGNIGSGKTYVCEIFKSLGVPVYIADLEARKILITPEAIQELIQVFGTKILNGEEIDRKSLANIVFNDPVELNKLNEIIHPKLREHFNLWVLENKSHPYVIQEAAILFENGFDAMMYKNITVSASKELRLQRAMKRDSANEKEILARMDHQWSDEEKENAADYIIYNGGEDLLPQVLDINKKLTIVELNEIICTFINDFGEKEYTGMSVYTGFLKVKKEDLSKLALQISTYLNTEKDILKIIYDFNDGNFYLKNYIKYSDGDNFGLSETIINELK